ncbi:hypothetical protein UFOVP235_60 [uncultured Caudovirales phage]|uniref:Uncharacterized protein n=1 Tax=uncultured Caudovirales phage TaxID=2100421 RepID=A0A6J7WZH2_9CAUD|nr:hypothetical protein UFOVP235_60 [uncultured Caudovirales phage]
MQADFWLGVGDAALVLRDDGTIEVKAFDQSFYNKNIVTCVGLMWSLENKEWRAKLEAKAQTKWKTVLDGGVKSDEETS